MNIELLLPWPPTVNSYYVKTRNGIFISKSGRKYRDALAESVNEQLGAFCALTSSLLVEVELYPPDRRKRDLDNYMKALLDACTKAGFWEDDSLIDQLFIYRGEVTRSGLVILKVGEAGPVIPLAERERIA